jgi:uncharacterized membrane protein YbaN (DUF454 family)
MQQDTNKSDQSDLPTYLCGPMRHIMFGFGLLCTAIGIAGLILPILPGTVFLLIAVWAFSRSSERFHLWLYNHPRFGTGVRNWHRHRVIPTRAKIAAVSFMVLSLAIVWHTYLDQPMVPIIVGATLAVVSLWIVTRTGRLPDNLD